MHSARAHVLPLCSPCAILPAFGSSTCGAGAGKLKRVCALCPGHALCTLVCCISCCCISSAVLYSAVLYQCCCIVPCCCTNAAVLYQVAVPVLLCCANAAVLYLRHAGSNNIPADIAPAGHSKRRCLAVPPFKICYAASGEDAVCCPCLRELLPAGITAWQDYIRITSCRSSCPSSQPSSFPSWLLRNPQGQLHLYPASP